MSNKKFARFVLIVFVGLMVLTACEGETVEVTHVVKETVVKTETVVEEVEKLVTSRGTHGTLTIVSWQIAEIMNSHLGGGNARDASYFVLEPLAHLNEVGELVPRLGQEIPTLENGGVAEDLRSITWKLREGILWSDGTPLTAEDVVFTAEYCLHPDVGCSFLDRLHDIESVEALDELTVKVNFSVPMAVPLEHATVPILQKAQFADCLGSKAQECTEQNFYPVGTGPYKVKEFRPNDVIVYEVNENYRDANKPYFSEVIWKLTGDAVAAARTVLETGEADLSPWVQVEPKVLRSMELAGKAKVIVAYGPLIEHLAINFTNPDPVLGDKRSVWTEEDPNPHPFLTDFAVRKALSLAIDRTAIASQLYGPAGQATCNFLVAPPAYVSTANDDCLFQDIEQANQILDEAGWLPGPDGVREKDGVRLSVLLQTSVNPVRESTMALLKQWWSEIGVETELRTVDPSVYFGSDPSSPDTFRKFYADIEMHTTGQWGVNPELRLVTQTCDEIPQPANSWSGGSVSRWCNPEYDALLAELINTVDMEKRIELAKELNDMIVQDYALIPLVHRGLVGAHANSLLGVRLAAWNTPFWNVADWSRSGR